MKTETPQRFFCVEGPGSVTQSSFELVPTCALRHPLRSWLSHYRLQAWPFHRGTTATQYPALVKPCNRLRYQRLPTGCSAQQKTGINPSLPSCQSCRTPATPRIYPGGCGSTARIYAGGCGSL